MPLEKVLRHMRAGEFKPNCAIGTFFASFSLFHRLVSSELSLTGMLTVVIEFLIRHGLITAENEPNLIEIITRLHGRFGFERW